MTTPEIAAEVARCRVAQSDWTATAIPARLRSVRRLRHLLAENWERLALTATQDVGRNHIEVLATDVLPTADALHYLERRAARILKPRVVSRRFRPTWLMGEREAVHRRPFGVVGVIGTWNYPIILNAVPIAQALVAGNGVIWKPSELAPTCGQYLHELFQEAGFPADLFIRLPANRDIGPQLIEANIDHLVFTGSASVGQRIAARLGERLVPSTMELSGCDAMIVLDDADLDMSARAAWYGSTLNAGQTCLATRRVIVHRSRYSGLLERLRHWASTARSEPLVMMSQVEQADRLVADAIAQGARRLVDPNGPGSSDDPPRFCPTILVDVTPEMAICREAYFAPLMAVMPFDTDAQAIEYARAYPYGLTASIFTANVKRAEQLATRLPVGSVTINDVIVGTAHPAVPFGGRAMSGWGVTRGDEGLLGLTVPQVSIERKGRFRPHYQGAGAPGAREIMSGMMRKQHAASRRERWRGLCTLLAGLWRASKN